jgi:DMSO/TMAO reductase YedYZ heme-binding membrane subunit
MPSSLTQGPMLWYLNRGSGVAVLLVLTATICLGILAGRGGTGRVVPRFAGQQLHRNLGVLGLVLVVGHAATAVVDSYVDIRWWQAFSPVGATYKPFWLGLGSIVLDLMLLLALSSLARHRMGPRAWRTIHLLGYLCWPVAMMHSVGIGTDAPTAWGRDVGLGCLLAVVAAALVRTLSDVRSAGRTGARPQVRSHVPAGTRPVEVERPVR